MPQAASSLVSIFTRRLGSERNSNVPAAPFFILLGASHGIGDMIGVVSKSTYAQPPSDLQNKLSAALEMVEPIQRP